MGESYSLEHVLADVRCGLSPSDAEYRLRDAGLTVSRRDRKTLREAARQRQYPRPLREHSDKRLAVDIANTVWPQIHGRYQAKLLRNGRVWSGACLQGAARKWGVQYAESLDELMRRINGALRTPFGN